jgi:hypothetical protein
VLALLAVTAFVALQHLFDQGRTWLLHEKGRTSLLNDRHRLYRSTEGRPLVGQAYVIANARTAASPHQHPVPIASVAKAMTAYLVLKHYPLHAGDSGRRFVVGQGDVAHDVHGSKRIGRRHGLDRPRSAAPGAGGGQGSDAGGDDGDPQLLAARSPVVTNTNALLGQDGFVGMKTGSLLAAGRSAARQLVDRLAATGGAGSSTSSRSAEHPRPGQPGLGRPPGVYRRRIENHIRPGNTPLS